MQPPTAELVEANQNPAEEEEEVAAVDLDVVAEEAVVAVEDVAEARRITYPPRNGIVSAKKRNRPSLTPEIKQELSARLKK